MEAFPDPSSLHRNRITLSFPLPRRWDFCLTNGETEAQRLTYSTWACLALKLMLVPEIGLLWGAEDPGQFSYRKGCSQCPLGPREPLEALEVKGENVWCIRRGHTWGEFLGGSEGKASACKAGDLYSISRLGRSPGEGNRNPLQYSCLENPMDRGAWCRLQSMGSQRVEHD